MTARRILLILFACGWTALAHTQPIQINGTIFSFKGEKVVLLKKAQKNVSFDGSLSGAHIEVKGDAGNQSITTGLSGYFSIKLQAPGKYHVTVNKSGYSTIEFVLDYAEAGERTRYESLFLILKQDDETKVNMGTIKIADAGILGYDKQNADNIKSDLFESNAHLIEKTVLINKSGAGGSSSTTEIKKTQPEKQVEEVKRITLYDTVKTNAESKITDPLFLIHELSQGNVDSLKMNLESAKAMLEKLAPGSSEYLVLQKQIEAAEQKIRDHEKIINLQRSELSMANKIIVYMSLFCVLVVGAAVLLFFFFRQKKKHAAVLAEKNKNIQRVNTKLLSSIRYASLIQTSFLREKEELKKLFPESFIFNQPKDVLSGDFYWFSNKNGHRIVVLADCTGHGVPGALLTVLGHTMLEDIINVKGEVVPSKILLALNKAIQQTFANNTSAIEYGMDITVISIKDNAKELLLSGVGNGLYKVQKDKIVFYPVSPKTLGPDITEQDLTDQKISIEPKDNLFLFTDGYADQFGGPDGKAEKFNLKRFEKVLTDSGAAAKLPDGAAVLNKTINDWKGDKEQVDDVCVVGLRV